MVPVEIPGHGLRSHGTELPVGDLCQLATQIVQALFPCPKPFALLGVSAGSLVAFQVARELASVGLEPPVALYTLSEENPEVFRDGNTAGVAGRPVPLHAEKPMEWEVSELPAAASGICCGGVAAGFGLHGGPEQLSLLRY